MSNEIGIAATRDAVAELIAKRADWLVRRTYSIAASGYVLAEDKWSETSTEVRNRTYKLADEIAALVCPAEGANPIPIPQKPGMVTEANDVVLKSEAMNAALAAYRPWANNSSAQGIFAACEAYHAVLIKPLVAAAVSMLELSEADDENAAWENLHDAVEPYVPEYLAAVTVGQKDEELAATRDETEKLVQLIHQAIFECPHTIVADEIVLRRSDRSSGNALFQLDQRVRASLPPAIGD